jgi:alpha-galactosidase
MTASVFLGADLQPTHITAHTESGVVPLAAAPGNRWTGGSIEVETNTTEGRLPLRLSAPGSAINRLHLRWETPLAARPWRFLGDAWKRAYGDLEWRGIVPERAMPWYFAGYDGERTHCCGVRTGPRAFIFFQVDSEGVSLWADVRSGGRGVELEGRVLDVCEIVTRTGAEHETPFATLHAFCREMCPNPIRPDHPLYGHNDWYYAYGNNSAESILADCHRTVGLAPDGKNRPYTVIDAGWQPRAGTDGGPWDHGNPRFPDMPGLASQMRQAGARPGIWVRPLAADPDAPAAWRLPRDHAYLDPSLPEVREYIARDIERLHHWGYDLIKHDFTTYDILGQWGFQMGASPTHDGWSFAAGRKQTTAEVILDLYTVIRDAAGSSIVLGCNTVSHLTAGMFAANRIGDDTSGRDWDRTRKFGVNSLAFRAAQQGAFYDADADCVGITPEIPWALNRQWLDLVARSGTALFVSLDPRSAGPAESADLRAAFALAAKGPELGVPTDWLENANPATWRFGNETATFRWAGPDGATPLPEVRAAKDVGGRVAYRP